MEPLFHGTGVYAPGRTVGAIWPHHDIIILLEGRLGLRIGGKEYAFGESDAIVIPPHNLFEGEALTPVMTMWVLHFKGYHAASDQSPFHRARNPFIVPSACGSHRDRGLLREFSQRWEERFVAPSCERSLKLLAELIVTRVEEALHSPRKAESPRLRAAIEAAIPGGSGDAVAQMAHTAGLGPSRFRQAFKEHYGISPSRYLLKARMEEARRLLGGTSQPIKEIGQKVGYSELAAFHRAFRKETNTTPAAYRKRFGGVV